MKNNTYITVHDLIIRFCELANDTMTYEESMSTMYPNFDWSISKFSDEPYKLVRLKQINAMFKAFNITCSYEDFYFGKFFTDKDTLQNMTKKYLHYIENEFTESIFEHVEDDTNVDFAMKFLLMYRIKITNLLAHHQSVLCSSGFNTIAYFMVKKLNEEIEQKIKLIDDVLACTIDPKNLRISYEDMIDKYGFPTNDLNAIDLDFI